LLIVVVVVVVVVVVHTTVSGACMTQLLPIKSSFCVL
jgi:hypothetical protein